MRFPYLTVLLTVALFGAALSAGLGMYSVEGQSMEPAIRSGTIVLVNRLAYVHRGPAVGDIVVVRTPFSGHPSIKRVLARTDDGSLFVTGDNLEVSLDSRHFGPVALHDILGRVVGVRFRGNS